jgi:hypothetical protein
MSFMSIAEPINGTCCCTSLPLQSSFKESSTGFSVLPYDIKPERNEDYFTVRLHAVRYSQSRLYVYEKEYHTSHLYNVRKGYKAGIKHTPGEKHTLSDIHGASPKNPRPVRHPILQIRCRHQKVESGPTPNIWRYGNECRRFSTNARAPNTALDCHNLKSYFVNHLKCL